MVRAQNNIPYPPEKEENTRYLWRDIERRANKHGLPVPKTPVPYPLQNFAKVIGKSREQVINNEYDYNTQEALNKGIFGAPSFSVENKIFWGVDRLEDAIAFLKESVN